MPDLTTLPVEPLGETGMEITRVGFGSWAVGGADWEFGWGSQDDADSIAAIRHALDLGINWIDTAAVYGLGHSEELVGRAIADMDEASRPYIFTKCGMVWDDAHPERSPDFVARPETIKTEVEGSLRRLGVERIDLYQVHWPPHDDTPIEEYWQVMLDLKRAGKIAAVGLSNHGVALLERAEAVGHVDSVQPPFSAVHREAGGTVAPWCEAHGTGMIVYSPMQAGLLTGAFTAERAAALPDDDWRRTSDDFTGEALDRNLALAAAIGDVAKRHEVTTAAAAVAWTLAWPGVTGAIVGARRPDQADGWIDAARLELTEADLDDVEAAIRTTGAGEGPARPPHV